MTFFTVCQRKRADFVISMFRYDTSFHLYRSDDDDKYLSERTFQPGTDHRPLDLKPLTGVTRNRLFLPNDTDKHVCYVRYNL